MKVKVSRARRQDQDRLAEEAEGRAAHGHELVVHRRLALLGRTAEESVKGPGSAIGGARGEQGRLHTLASGARPTSLRERNRVSTNEPTSLSGPAARWRAVFVPQLHSASSPRFWAAAASPGDESEQGDGTYSLTCSCAWCCRCASRSVRVVGEGGLSEVLWLGWRLGCESGKTQADQLTDHSAELPGPGTGFAWLRICTQQCRYSCSCSAWPLSSSQQRLSGSGGS